MIQNDKIAIFRTKNMYTDILKKPWGHLNASSMQTIKKNNNSNSLPGT